MKGSDIVNIDKKLAKYIQSFELENRMNVVYDLAFKMSIATRGAEIEDQKEFNELIKDDDMFSTIIGPE